MLDFELSYSDIELLMRILKAIFRKFWFDLSLYYSLIFAI
jgi:hypothetical protein